MKRNSLLLTLFTTLLLGATLAWVGGCDFSRVDEGAEAPLEEHLAAVNSARTEAQAVKAVRGILNKTGVGIRGQHQERPSTYEAYALSHAQVEAVARALVAFNEGDAAAGYQMSDTYDLMVAAAEATAARAEQSRYPMTKGARPLTATVDEVLDGFRILSRQAHHRPEKADNALVMAVAADGVDLPAANQEYADDRWLSPVQHLLFSIWLDRHAPVLPLYTQDAGLGKQGGDPNENCGGGTTLCAKFENPPQYSYEKPAGNENIVTITGDDTRAEWTSTKPISTIIIKGAQDTYTYYDVLLTNGGTEGVITNENLHVPNGSNNAGISNVQFCTGDDPFDHDECIGECRAQYTTCLSSDEKTDEECLAEQEFCFNECHDQGSTTTP